jgi:hypothetical protein
MKLLLVLSLASSLVLPAFCQDVADLLAEGQRAYLRNDIATAKEKFELIRKIEPDNRIAVGYLRRIIAEEMKEAREKGPANVTEGSLKALILPRVQFVDASLGETLEYLRQKGNQIGAGKVAINFVMQIDEAAKNRKVTLTLQNVPFTEVMRYIGDMAGVQFAYERFAIVVKPKAGAPAATNQPVTPTPDGGVKIEGL